MASIRTSSSVSRLERRAHSDLPSIPASDLKNRFGEICQRAAKGAVAITRHQRAEFVLLPIAQYEELQQARTAPLDALAAQFDALVTKMNTPAAKRGVKGRSKMNKAELEKAVGR